MTISNTIRSFVHQAIQLGYVDEMDRYYITNRLLSLLQLSELEAGEFVDQDLLTSMDQCVYYAIEHNIIADLSYEKEQFEAAIMDLITPSASSLNALFWEKYRRSPEEATDYFYALSQANDYIKTRNIAKNIQFTSPFAPYPDLEITINLSKPEKDPKEIALAKTMKQSNYPLCLLCFENEGYQGRTNHPARQQHRLIRLSLNDRAYGMQYSPYVYYNEHSIFLSQEHTPMAINRKALDNLLAIVEYFPHYFAGSNADLPIVGGSILAHDHYQGGRHTFPMEQAEAFETVTLTQYPFVTATLVNWPMSVIRLKGCNRHQVADAGEALLDFWRGYSDETVEILSHTQNTPHNTITPVARRRGEDYELDIVLRNNRTNELHPDGIFHPHADVQHIKKENIGLIEVMGLAILPPRLVEELDTISKYLLNKVSLEDVANYHQSWAKTLKDNHPDMDEEHVNTFLEKQVGKKFGRVLEDAGVFKQTPKGRAAFLKFIEQFNQNSI